MSAANQKRKPAPKDVWEVTVVEKVVHTFYVAHEEERVARGIADLGGGDYQGSETTRITGSTSSRRPAITMTDAEVITIRQKSVQSSMTKLSRIPRGSLPVAKPGVVKALPPVVKKGKKSTP